MSYRSDFLSVLYDNIKTALKLDKKLSSNSVLISFMNLKSNVRYSYMLKSAQSSLNTPEAVIRDLLNDGAIRSVGEDETYSLTAMGVWELEKDNKLTEIDLINFIDEKFWAIETSSKDISEKEKVIILTLIAIRAFSKDCNIDLKSDDNLLESVKRIIDKSYELLHKMDMISFEYEKLYGKKGNEHIVSNLIRHTDSLPKKTKAIFNAIGDQKYTLLLSQNNNIQEDDLKWLLEKIFDQSKLKSLYDYDMIKDFLNTVAYEEGFNIYENIEESFVTHKVDDVINRVIKNMMLGD